jgi:hypothetical protein
VRLDRAETVEDFREAESGRIECLRRSAKMIYWRDLNLRRVGSSDQMASFLRLVRMVFLRDLPHQRVGDPDLVKSFYRKRALQTRICLPPLAIDPGEVDWVAET